ncbi:large ribosomal subunit protein eL20z-like [Quercus suber]|uniref:large ribosomal subunit protein eL20z-like n=1 Tax=Quercus suber TaxID=58331 RepID=UPI0032DEC73E
MDQRLSTDVVDHKNGAYAEIKDVENPELGMFDKPLPCFGCGIGWFSLLLGLVCPLLWYYATFLYFRKYYQRDPRERDGLAANAVAALICTIAVIIAGVVILTINLATNPHQ